MCLAIPARIIEIISGDSAVIDLDGVRKQVSIALLDQVAVGDYVIIHVGYALQKIDPDEARRTLELMADWGSTVEEGVAT